MSATRRYRLLCPIARALDRVGDRWTLLILRDLHAGPARFSDIQSGLKGIAANLLTDRLRQLADDGLIERYDGQHGVTLYGLTDVGRKTGALLFELALFGGQFPASPDVRQPGNLRTVAVMLAAACNRVSTPDMNFEGELRVDDEPFTVSVRNGAVDVEAGPATNPVAIMQTSYEPLVAVTDGGMSIEQFVSHHRHVAGDDAGAKTQLLTLLGGAIREIRGKP